MCIRDSNGSAAAPTPASSLSNALVSAAPAAARGLPATELPKAKAPVSQVDVPTMVETGKQTVSTDDVVARVDGVAITLQDLHEATRIDSLMATLAGAPPTAAESLTEQLINTEIILQRAEDAQASIDVAAVLAIFLQSHGKAHEELTAALQTNGCLLYTSRCV